MAWKKATLKKNLIQKLKSFQKEKSRKDPMNNGLNELQDKVSNYGGKSD